MHIFETKSFPVALECVYFLDVSLDWWYLDLDLVRYLQR
jgi:hypothetical protein